MTDLLVTMARDGIGALEVREDVYTEYNERLDEPTAAWYSP